MLPPRGIKGRIRPQAWLVGRYSAGLYEHAGGSVGALIDDAPVHGYGRP